MDQSAAEKRCLSPISDFNAKAAEEAPTVQVDADTLKAAY
jgi:hypothetical protein